MKLRAATLILLFVAAAASAETITTRDGRVYTGATVSRVEPDGINIVHSAGAAKIRFENLPADLQARYGYDATKAAAFTQQQAAAKSLAARQRQALVDHAEAEREARAQTEIAKRRAVAHAAETAVVLSWLALFGGCLAAVCLYFVPTFVGRNKTNAKAIFVLNFFAGWTFVGWVMALVWACTKDTDTKNAFP